MKVRRVGVCDLDGLAGAVRLQHALAQENELHWADGRRTDLAEPTMTHQTMADTAASTLPEELVQEILLRVPPDEPADLVHATVVCKVWHRILSADTFRRRYHRFHRTPPLQGYIYNNVSDSTIQFVPTTTSTVAAAASPVSICTPILDEDDSRVRKPWALDCRHGRVLIETGCKGSPRDRRLIVWDSIAGGWHHLGLLPTYRQYPYRHDYVGAVLCAKCKDGCDHLDCHGGPFLVVLVGMSYDNDEEEDGQTWASLYSSVAGSWSSPTTPDEETNHYIDYTKPSLLIGDALYFIAGGYNIIKYDLSKHVLSVIHLPGRLQSTILMKGDDGGLGVAAMRCSCVYMWSWRVDNSGGIGEWVMCRVMELGETQLPKGYCLPDLMCMAEGTATVFIGMEDIGVFTLDLNSRLVTKVGAPKTYYRRPILPYISFNTPKH